MSSLNLQLAKFLETKMIALAHGCQVAGPAHPPGWTGSTGEARSCRKTLGDTLGSRDRPGTLVLDRRCRVKEHCSQLCASMASSGPLAASGTGNLGSAFYRLPPPPPKARTPGSAPEAQTQPLTPSTGHFGAVHGLNSTAHCMEQSCHLWASGPMPLFRF